jgi:hypothetical protein
VSGHRPDLGRIGIWAGDLDSYPTAGVRDAVAAIEDAGYGALWFPETTGREAMAQAGILLSATQRIVVATREAVARVGRSVRCGCRARGCTSGNRRGR